MQVGEVVRDRGGGQLAGEETGWNHQRCRPEGAEITPKELFGFGTRHRGDGDGWWVRREQGCPTWHGMSMKDPM